METESGLARTIRRELKTPRGDDHDDELDRPERVNDDVLDDSRNRALDGTSWDTTLHHLDDSKVRDVGERSG